MAAVPLRHTMSKTLHGFDPVVTQKELTLERALLEGEAPDTCVLCDQHRLAQVMSNLIRCGAQREATGLRRLANEVTHGCPLCAATRASL